LEKSSTWEDLETFINELLKNITPGHHFVASIGDAMPPDADFDCLMYIGDNLGTLRKHNI